MTNGYGLTETFTLCTWAEPEETGGEFRIVHGRPLPGIDLRIVDGETAKRSRPGELGEIAVKGVTFMLGYYKGYAEEYLDRNGYFRTGDSGYLDENGILHWGGRLTGMIKTAGANVSPVEIESKLLPLGSAQAGHASCRSHIRCSARPWCCAPRATTTTRSAPTRSSRTSRPCSPPTRSRSGWCSSTSTSCPTPPPRRSSSPTPAASRRSASPPTTPSGPRTSMTRTPDLLAEPAGAAS